MADAMVPNVEKARLLRLAVMAHSKYTEEVTSLNTAILLILNVVLHVEDLNF